MNEFKILQVLKTWHTGLRLAFLLVFCSCVAGCADFKVRVGMPIDTSSLDQLEIGKSREADVRSALGDPFGSGRSYLAFQSEYTDLWSYYYELGTLEDDRRTFLFVFLNEGVYQGHMWFSSLPEAQR